MSISLNSQDLIRNFCIIAHIDHGKSTLADRLIQETQTISEREFHDQVLDSMDIEQERGITIKSQAITLAYSDNNVNYILNLIDTPGHVDFSYEVSRALYACEGAILIIDASQGVQAQTLANLYHAVDHNLEIIPVINKIDLPTADIEEVKNQMEGNLGISADEAICISAKEGIGIDKIFSAIIKKIPCPEGNPDDKLRALIFDSHYDSYRGTVVHIRVMDGTVKTGDAIKFYSNNAVYKVEEVGLFQLKLVKKDSLKAGEVGYIIAGVKTVSDTRTGDTITHENDPCEEPLEGFKEVKPYVFSSIYPIASDDYEELKVAMDKLKLNDASLVYTKDTSLALGNGFRCGFLGLLHLEIVQERLEREFGLSLIITAPSVQYRIILKTGVEFVIDNPIEFPDPLEIEHSFEPIVRADIITPDTYIGPLIKLCEDRRGVQNKMDYLDERRVELSYTLPLAEIVYDFYDRLKTVSRGYASFDYEITGYQDTKLVKLEILVNGKPVDALSQIVFKDSAYKRARKICEKLKDEIPRKQFKIPIQGCIGGSIIARETISAYRKDVTAKCYGGDISRKRKLLEKQKEGKKRMKMIGSVEIPQNAFIAVLKEE